MSERIAIDFDLLSAHAGRVDLVAADVRMAQEAANSTDIGGGAFGLMCSFMVPPVQLVATLARGTIAAAAGMIDRSAEEIRGVASDFAAYEEYAEKEFRGIQQGSLGE